MARNSKSQITQVEPHANEISDEDLGRVLSVYDAERSLTILEEDSIMVRLLTGDDTASEIEEILHGQDQKRVAELIRAVFIMSDCLDIDSEVPDRLYVFQKYLGNLGNGMSFNIRMENLLKNLYAVATYPLKETTAHSSVGIKENKEDYSSVFRILSAYAIAKFTRDSQKRIDYRIIVPKIFDESWLFLLHDYRYLLHPSEIRRGIENFIPEVINMTDYQVIDGVDIQRMVEGNFYNKVVHHCLEEWPVINAINDPERFIRALKLYLTPENGPSLYEARRNLNVNLTLSTALRSLPYRQVTRDDLVHLAESLSDGILSPRPADRWWRAEHRFTKYKRIYGRPDFGGDGGLLVDNVDVVISRSQSRDPRAFKPVG